MELQIFKSIDNMGLKPDTAFFNQESIFYMDELNKDKGGEGEWKIKYLSFDLNSTKNI